MLAEALGAIVTTAETENDMALHCKDVMIIDPKRKM
jgi:hypothetical protein